MTKDGVLTYCTASEANIMSEMYLFIYIFPFISIINFKIY